MRAKLLYLKLADMDCEATSQIVYRPMTVLDLTAAHRLWAEAEGIELAEGDGPLELSAYLQRNPGTSHVALKGTHLVGAVLAGHDGRRGFLYHLAVDPDLRGKGIGRELVKRSLSDLKSKGISRVLILVAQDNDRGARFWEKCGWEPLSIASPMGINL